MPDDYVSEADLTGLDLTPEQIRVFYPWAVELIALDGSRCWAVEDLTLDDGGDA